MKQIEKMKQRVLLINCREKLAVENKLTLIKDFREKINFALHNNLLLKVNIVLLKGRPYLL